MKLGESARLGEVPRGKNEQIFGCCGGLPAPFCPPVEKSLRIDNFSPKTSQPFIWNRKIFFETFPCCMIKTIATQK